MAKLTITSDKNLTPEELEEELVKAANSIQLKHEKKQFRDVYLKARKDEVGKAVSLVFQSMISEIEKVLKSTK